MKPHTTEIRCTIHNVHFMSETPEGSNMVPTCSFCQQEKINRLREELELANDHKEALLRAINIKLLSEPA